jgi:hypothetical protein
VKNKISIFFKLKKKNRSSYHKKNDLLFLESEVANSTQSKAQFFKGEGNRSVNFPIRPLDAYVIAFLRGTTWGIMISRICSNFFINQEWVGRTKEFPKRTHKFLEFFDVCFEFEGGSESHSTMMKEKNEKREAIDDLGFYTLMYFMAQRVKRRPILLMELKLLSFCT